MWMNDLNAWHHICFLICLLPQGEDSKEKNRAREAKNNRSVLHVLFNLQTVPNFSNYQAAKQTEASRQELAVSCGLHFGGSCLIWGKTRSISCTNTSRANTPLPARAPPFRPLPTRTSFMADGVVHPPSEPPFHPHPRQLLCPCACNVRGLRQQQPSPLLPPALALL